MLISSFLLVLLFFMYRDKNLILQLMQSQIITNYKSFMIGKKQVITLGHVQQQLLAYQDQVNTVKIITKKKQKSSLAQSLVILQALETMMLQTVLRKVHQLM